MGEEPSLTEEVSGPKHGPEPSKVPEVSREHHPGDRSGHDGLHQRQGFEYRRMKPRECEIDQVLSLIEKQDWRIISFRFWPGRFYSRGGGYEILLERPK